VFPVVHIVTLAVADLDTVFSTYTTIKFQNILDYIKTVTTGCFGC